MMNFVFAFSSFCFFAARWRYWIENGPNAFFQDNIFVFWRPLDIFEGLEGLKQIFSNRYVSDIYSNATLYFWPSFLIQFFYGINLINLILFIYFYFFGSYFLSASIASRFYRSIFSFSRHLSIFQFFVQFFNFCPIFQFLSNFQFLSHFQFLSNFQFLCFVQFFNFSLFCPISNFCPNFNFCRFSVSQFCKFLSKFQFLILSIFSILSQNFWRYCLAR